MDFKIALWFLVHIFLDNVQFYRQILNKYVNTWNCPWYPSRNPRWCLKVFIYLIIEIFKCDLRSNESSNSLFGRMHNYLGLAKDHTFPLHQIYPQLPILTFFTMSSTWNPFWQREITRTTFPWTLIHEDCDYSGSDLAKTSMINDLTCKSAFKKNFENTFVIGSFEEG